MDYEQIRAVRWSHLKILLRGAPLHYRHAETHPDEGDTTSRVVLRAIHAAVLEPDSYSDRYAVFTGPRRAGKEWDAFESANIGREILKANEAESIKRVAWAVRTHPAVIPLFSAEHQTEVGVYWLERGIMCKGRIDLLVHRGYCGGDGRADVAIYDLKTVDSADPIHVRYLARRNGWIGQLAHYRAGVRLGMYPDARVTCYIIAAEQKAPHDVVVYRLTETDLAEADNERIALLDIVAECERDGRWPGRFDEPVELPMDLDRVELDNVTDDDTEPPC